MLGQNIMVAEYVWEEALPLLASRKQKERGRGQDTVPMDLITPISPHLPKFPEPPQIVPPAWDQALNT
jgi:hypothetical protein